MAQIEKSTASSPFSVQLSMHGRAFLPSVTRVGRHAKSRSSRHLFEIYLGANDHTAKREGKKGNASPCTQLSRAAG